MGALMRWPWALRALAIMVAVLITLLVRMGCGPLLTQWDEESGSAAWSLGDAARQERRVVVVDIDEKSIQALGAWPWPRALTARLLTRLDQEGVRLKMLDMLFDVPRPGDESLAVALRSPVPTVVGELFSLDAQPAPLQGGQLAGALPVKICPSTALETTGYLGPEAGLLPVGGRAGHIVPILDPDGTIRRVPALLCHDRQAYLSLPLAGVWAAVGGVPHVVPGAGLTAPDDWLELGEWRMPVDSHGRYRVSYQVPRAGFVSISARDVLDGRVPPGLLKGAWALVGVTAFGAGDVVPTPQGGAVSGVEVHAQTLSALLDERTPYTPTHLARLWPWLGGALTTLMMLAALTSRSRAGLLLPVAGVTGCLALYGWQAFLLLQEHWWLGWVTPGLYTMITLLTLGSSELSRVRFEREQIYRHLSSYLPETAAREMARQDPSAQVQAIHKEATVLFADLRNFSAFCEGRPAEESATVLHLFYTHATRIVEAHGGVVEQMVGDGLMAVWNGSEPCPHHAHQAMVAAGQLWQELSQALPMVRAGRIPAMDVGVGVETGRVLIGSFGSARRRVHTVLGETVSVAAALQAMTGELACPVLLGPQLIQQAHPPTALRPLGQFLLPGLNRPRILYALPVELDPQRLHLIFEAESSKKAAG